MIWLAESTGDKFYDESDGSFLASMVKSVMTYWTQYKEINSQTFEILGVYCHRMRFEREGQKT